MRRIMIGTWMVAAYAMVAFCMAASAAGKFPVAGRVVNESGEGVAGAYVCAIEILQAASSITEVSAETTTDEAGRFAMKLSKAPMLREAYVYTFAARHPDYGVAWEMSSSMPFTGDSVTDFTLTMPNRGSIKGIVTDPEGNPVAGALVTPWLNLEAAGPVSISRFLPPCERFLSAKTAPDGRFDLDDDYDLGRLLGIAPEALDTKIVRPTLEQTLTVGSILDETGHTSAFAPDQI